ncbi:hypothetical protein VTN02DRAFT_2435 [Thermoascus thermophilus]
MDLPESESIVIMDVSPAVGDTVALTSSASVFCVMSHIGAITRVLETQQDALRMPILDSHPLLQTGCYTPFSIARRDIRIQARRCKSPFIELLNSASKLGA